MEPAGERSGRRLLAGKGREKHRDIQQEQVRIAGERT